MENKLLRIDAERLKRNPPKLYDGETMPNRSVYWLIWVMDEKTGKPYHSRVTNDKQLTPIEAAFQCYGIPPTEAMRFFNLTHTVTGMRKRLREVAKLWPRD